MNHLPSTQTVKKSEKVHFKLAPLLISNSHFCADVRVNCERRKLLEAEGTGFLFVTACRRQFLLLAHQNQSQTEPSLHSVQTADHEASPLNESPALRLHTNISDR